MKNVYSIVLSADVVEKIDRLAYENGTNRSNMINRILAEYVSYTTPEMRFREVFERMQRMLTGGDFKALEPSDTMLSLRSALAYKYNPTVKYSVELYRGNADATGELRVSMRTQNAGLVLMMTEFYKLGTRWNPNIEASRSPSRAMENTSASLSCRAIRKTPISQASSPSTSTPSIAR